MRDLTEMTAEELEDFLDKTSEAVEESRSELEYFEMQESEIREELARRRQAAESEDSNG